MKAISQHLIWSNGMQPEVLAREFSRRLRLEIGDARVALVNLKNSTVQYIGACASHDYCDANMVMLGAFADLSGEKPNDVKLDEVMDLFNKAWDIARNNMFFHETGEVRVGDRE